MKGMAARGFGRIVNIASDAGRVGSSGEAVYSACKGGIIAFAKTMSRELVSKGIIINTLCPGPTDTAILRSFLEGPDGAKIAEGLKRAIPMRRLEALRIIRASSRSFSPTMRPTSPARPSASPAASPCTDERHSIMEKYKDILFDVRDGVATITINRPEKYNAFTAETCEELIDAFRRAGYDKSVAVIVLGGAGDKAFCTGADQSAHEGAYEGRGTIGLPIDELQSLIRDVPKPVIARVQGFAIGGGNVLATLCDLTIASEQAVFGQVGPKVGSVDPGFGTAYLARLVGEKRAREIWYLCRRYTAKEAYDMGMVNAVVPAEKLDEEVDKWCAEIREKEPDGARHRQALVQRRQREPARHRRARLRGAGAVLRHRGIQRGRRLPRKARQFREREGRTTLAAFREQAESQRLPTPRAKNESEIKSMKK